MHLPINGFMSKHTLTVAPVKKELANIGCSVRGDRISRHRMWETDGARPLLQAKWSKAQLSLRQCFAMRCLLVDKASDAMEESWPFPAANSTDLQNRLGAPSPWDVSKALLWNQH